MKPLPQIAANAPERVVILQRRLNIKTLLSRVNHSKLARFLMTVVWGVSVQAAGRASRAQLEEVAAMAIKSWPSSD
jgi:hypothetical protein